MSDRRHGPIGRFIARLVLVLAAIVAGPTSASANLDYRIWLFDDVYETFEYGDVSEDHTLLVPPAWACGIKFHDVIRIRQVDGVGATIHAFDMWLHDVVFVLPIPGCPDWFDGADHTAAHPNWIGSSYLEITMPNGGAGARWVDANGGWPDCGACSVAEELTFFPENVETLDLSLNEVRTLSASLFQGATQTRVDGAFVTLAAGISQLGRAVANGVAARRRHPLGDYEATVRPLEDAALAELAEAARQLESSAALARQRRFTDAFVAATLGRRSLESTQSKLRAVQSTLAGFQ